MRRDVVLLADRRVSAIPVRENGEELVRLPASFGPAGALVRVGLARRLLAAQAALPEGRRLRVVEGHRAAADQRAIVDAYRAELRATHPAIGEKRLQRLTSRFVAPLEVAPHVAGAAVDLTLTDHFGTPLPMGTEIDATPERSGGRCYSASADIPPAARRHRDLMGAVLRTAGLVNYPPEWWHWSFGDRYWALVTRAPAALYGPVDRGEAA